nr:uncharacterized protein LOC109733210 [Aegilops tauschii subsp. strangulata]
MAAASGSSSGKDALSTRAARARMEDAMGKLDLTEEEATPLILDDVDDGARPVWAIAGKVLHWNLLHIQTIANALRPAWGNPRGLVFRSAGENIFVAEFETQRDRDRVWDGSPWHVSKHAVILTEFKESMQPSELQFDKLRIWARVLNLPFNLRSDTRGKVVARQIDTNASAVQFDPVGGFLRARVTIDVRKPLRRWILIDSAARGNRDWYDI